MRMGRLAYRVCQWSIAVAGLSLYLFARCSMNPGISWIVCWHVLGGAVLGVPFCLYAFRALLTTKDGTIRQDVRGYSAIGILCYISGIALLLWAALGNSNGKLPLVFAFHVW